MGSNATQPRKRLGAWLARTYGDIYQAQTDGYVCAFAVLGAADTGSITFETDGSTPPTVDRNKFETHTSDSYAGMVYNLTCFVRKNHYWRATKALVLGSITVWWIPLEP